jgi:hypothetical protein
MTAYVADERARYQIRVHGRLEGLWAARLGEMALAIHSDDGDTVTELTGWVTDQAALMGVLEQLYSLGVTLVSVERLQEDGPRALASSETEGAVMDANVKEDR